MCSCFLCGYFLDPLQFKQFLLSRVSKRYRLNRNGWGKKHTQKARIHKVIKGKAFFEIFCEYVVESIA